eukprot:2475660-Karenia_brevis.AAC.1
MKKTLESQTTAVTEQGVRAYVKQQLELARRSKPTPMEPGQVQENDRTKMQPNEVEEWPEENVISDIDAMAKGKG